jgi:hypothetical protein
VVALATAASSNGRMLSERRLEKYEEEEDEEG